MVWPLKGGGKLPQVYSRIKFSKKNIFFKKNFAEIRMKFSCRHYDAKKFIHFHSPTRSNRSIEGRYFTPPLRPASRKCPRKCRKIFFSQFRSHSSKISSRRTFLSSLVIIWSFGRILPPQTQIPYIFTFSRPLTSNSNVLTRGLHKMFYRKFSSSSGFETWQFVL